MPTLKPGVSFSIGGRTLKKEITGEELKLIEKTLKKSAQKMLVSEPVKESVKSAKS